MRINKSTLGLLLAGSLMVAATTAQAGGPLANCDDGVPFAWGNAGQNITFNPDQGALGPLSNAQATAQVQFSFDQWGAVATSTASYVQGDTLPVDVDITNFDPFLNAVAPDGLSAIVYDANGEIFDLLFGAGSGILGFAGPEWGDTLACTIDEGLSFLNGPAFDDITAATDVMVHEFGHFSNLAHVQVNGAIGLGDFSGPGFNAFPLVFPADFVETMYPFYFGPGIGTQTLELDDIASLSSLYPTGNYTSDSATITGSVRIPDGATRVSGVNVIARNVDDPYDDASGILSGADTDAVNPAGSDFVGTFEFTGMTPGANYVVFVDEIVAGGFSTPPIALSPSPEEFYNGANESNSDDPTAFVLLSASAGASVANVDVILNQPQPGDPLPTGPFGDGSTRLFTPFPVDFCGTTYDSVFVNGNGNITFGAASGDFTESAGDLLAGPPRIAGLWDDLNSSAGGFVTFDTDNSSFFKLIWSDVPEFDLGGANSFSINLKAKHGNGNSPKKGNDFEIEHGDLTTLDGLSGYSCGGAIANGFETETDISRKRGKIKGGAAFFEQFVESFGSAPEGEIVDLAGDRARYRGVGAFNDRFELGHGNDDDDDDDDNSSGSRNNNDTVADATRIHPPFDNARRFAEIDLDSSDIDFYRFKAKAGETLAIEVVRGQLDSLIGLFDADTGDLLLFDDDGGNGLLSRVLTVPLPQDFNLAVGVTTFPDFGFTGAGGSGGGYVVSVRKYRGDVLFLGDDDSLEVPLQNGVEFQGEEYDSVFVNSNGNLTFGEGDTNFSENVFDLLNGPPRVSQFWDDLDPSGFFGNFGLYIVENEEDSTTVHGVSVSEFFSSSPNYFSVEIEDDGEEIEFSYGPTARNDALVGVSEGGGAVDPGPTDLSRGDDVEFEGTVYENFPNGFFDSTKTTPFSDFDLLFDEVELEEDD